MFGKMMNRYYYGKSGKGDFHKEDLPETRWQLFWEMLRVRFSALTRLNLMYMVVWIPALIVIGRGVMLCFNGLNAMMEAENQLTAGLLTQEAAVEQIQTLRSLLEGVVMQTLLYLFPCIAITGPVTAGVTYVTRNWARDEHAFIWGDLKDATKSNWKYGLLTSVITGFMPLMMYLSNYYYGQMAQNQVLFMVPQVLCLMLGCIWFLMLFYMYPLMVTYTLKYKDVLRNALLLSIAKLPMNVLLRVITLVPALIAAAVSFFFGYAIHAALILGLYYVVLGYTLSRFISVSYVNGVFDKYINTKIEGAQVNRGLYTEDDDDEDLDEQEEIEAESEEA